MQYTKKLHAEKLNFALMRPKSVLQQNYQRTAFLNALASELNAVIGLYSKELKRSGFYHELLRRFRREPLNDRLLLLWQLRGMDINARYKLNKLGSHAFTVTEQKQQVLVNLQVLLHPKRGVHRADCHCYEIIVLTWTKNNQPATHNRQYSEWIDIKGEYPEFDFLFPKPAGTTHWLLCIKQQLGKEEQPVRAFVATGMQIAAIGSFDKKEQALLDEKLAPKKTAQGDGGKKVKDVVRVKAKRVVG